MSKPRQYIPLQVGLSIKDRARLADVAVQTKRTKTSVAREAIRWYLEHYERLKTEERDSKLTQALKEMTNRLCGMLARQGTEIGTLYELKWQSMPDEEFLAALNKTKERLRQRLTKDEQALAAKHKKVLET